MHQSGDGRFDARLVVLVSDTPCFAQMYERGGCASSKAGRETDVSVARERALTVRAKIVDEGGDIARRALCVAARAAFGFHSWRIRVCNHDDKSALASVTLRPAKMIGKHFLVVGVLSCALVPGPASAEEIIEVTSCDPFDTEVGNGAEMVCVAPPDWMNDTGQTEDDPFDGPESDEYSKGGKKTKTKKKKSGGGGNPNAGKEAQRKARCKACKASADQCRSQAQTAEASCNQTAAGQAEWRCNINKQNGPGKTPWGCTTNDLFEGICSGVEAPWNDRDKWEPGGANTKYYCESSWRVSHPGGSVTSTDTTGFSVSFKGVGGSQSSTVTATYQLTGQQGYGLACTDVGSKLVAGCIGEQTKCLNENGCEGQDL